MANIKNLKKDINYVLGDIIEAVYLFEISTGKPTTETNDLIDEIAAFDALITKVNAKKVDKNTSNKSMLNWNKLQIS
jgi:hypothetical protein